MNTDTLNLLLIEDHPGDIRLVQEILDAEGAEQFALITANCLEEAVAMLQRLKADVILLDLQLPDGTGLDSLLRIQAVAPDVPIVVMSNIADEQLALQSVQRGAQDFLVKNHVNEHLLLRALRYAMERKRLEEQLYKLAHQDSLTGLANRKLFYDRLKTALATARRHELPLALLLLDINDFKPINDTHGHQAGDQLLQEVARRITECVREADCVARIGGDEFTLILADIREAGDAAAAARKILSQFERPFSIQGRELTVHASIGISLYPDDAAHLEDLVRAADTAMYRAKKEGGNAYSFYSRALDIRAGVSRELEEQLHQALEHGEFLVYYQPQVDIASGYIIGMECLLRWQHPQRGLMMPGDFMGILQSMPLMVEVGEWVLRTVCEQGRQWKEAGQSDLTLSVNVSRHQLMQEGFPVTLARILSESGFAPQNLELDIAEHALWEDEERAYQVLTALSRLGVRLALDNFGSGRASLHLLRKFPFHAIKLDRVLTQEAEAKPDGANLTRAVIQVAHVFRMRGLASGVETRSQLDILRNLACDDAQGYLYCHPLSGEAATDLLRRGRTLEPMAA
ncbi:MAG: EAL domain-containing protein [Methylophilaceae bacterium]|nr:EAL domain-containing protein [Methylophilaceae bacterium]